MRLTGFVLLAGCSLALAACGGAADESDDPAGAATTETGAMPAASPMATGTAEPTPSPTASATPSPTPSPSSSPKPAAAATTAAAPASAPTTFNQCKACHATEAGKHGIGPSLASVFGASSAHAAGFDYSAAMEGAGLTWNAATLDRYLENPRAVVPGTTMAFAGIKDDAKRKEVVDYLKTL